MSATASSQVLNSIRTVGGLLPADMLLRILDGKDVPGSKPADYHVVGVRSVKDAAERRWSIVKGTWQSLRAEIGDTGHDPRGLALEHWLLPLFDEHSFGRLQPSGGIPSDDGTMIFPVSHRWRQVPIHLVPWDQDPDKRPASGGLPPQSMLQQCLNRSEPHLWAVLSNGRQLRLLRDSSSLAGTAYIEFDLEAMFDGELFDEFVLLYRMLHVSRFEVPEGSPPSACWLEKWRVEAIEAGARALDQLRDGVRDAVVHLGTGFLRHAANDRVRTDLDPDLFKRALLRLVYRLLFWFVAEDREVLLSPSVSDVARDRYVRYFSASRLRTSALRRTGTPHGDLWSAVKLVLNALGHEDGLPRLGLIGLGGIYDETGTDQILRGLSLSNEHLLLAIKSLARVRDPSTGRWRRVDYRNLGAEELGSIYESLLELVPKQGGDRSFQLDVIPGNEKKTTGSYYTPTSLIDCLLDSSLDPVLDDAQKQAEVMATNAGIDVSTAVAEALLRVTVCDPACGSGHFLVAAARRIAKRVAAVREHNPEPTLDATRTALRDVVTHCIYGVDLNPMAVELAKVSLWMEGMEAGKSLGFLDAHIKHGNGLIGATPALIDKGIPEGAFKAVEGDDPAAARSLARANLVPVQDELFGDEYIFSQSNEVLAAGLTRITDAPSASLRDVHRQADAYRSWSDSAEHQDKVLVANAWCAAFMWIKTLQEGAPPAIVNRVFTALRERGAGAIPPATLTEIDRLDAEYNFFHWHLEFPDIFHVPDPCASTDTGWTGGFACVLANPPWDKVDFKDKEYFSKVEPSIDALAGQKRRQRIVEWEAENPEEGARYRAARRQVKAVFHFVSNSDLFPLCAKGLTAKGVTSLQTDQLFAEQFATITAPNGRDGCIIPTVLATGAGGQYLFRSFTDRSAIASLYDFENRKPLFREVDSRYKFCLLSLAGKGQREHATRLAFYLQDTPDLDEPDRVFTLTREEIALLSPNTRALPIFRSRRVADLTVSVYRRIPVLWDEANPDGNPWGITFKHMFNMTDDEDLFRIRETLESAGWRLEGDVFTREGKRMLPLYEGKIAYLFDHRWNSFVGAGGEEWRSLTLAEKRDPSACAYPRYWVAEGGLIPTRRNGRDVSVPGVSALLEGMKWERGWLCGWRDVCRATDERTSIPAFLPRAAVGNKIHLMFPGVSPILTASLIAVQSSLVFDFVSRQKIGGIAMGLFIWKQLPVPAPGTMESHLGFIAPHVLELVYTTYNMTPLARDLGDDGQPFTWDEERRAHLRAELDAFFFRLYGIERDDADYIMETFPIVKQHDVAKHGTYRTRDLILDAYDRMAAAEAVGEPYESPLSPPPGQGPRHPAAT
ncbi:MAG TPA: DNA methyltransferase [Streptosporangiaceae bacterium]|nr:DNA methyltransferase [Streptosporangiaceae bacterium]